MIGDILQPTHLLFILVVALLVLGPKRLPEVGRALGRGLRDFRHALNTDELREEMLSSTSMTSTSTETTTPLAQQPTPSSETPLAGEHATPTPQPEHPEPAAGTPQPAPAASAPQPDRFP